MSVESKLVSEQVRVSQLSLEIKNLPQWHSEMDLESGAALVEQTVDQGKPNWKQVKQSKDLSIVQSGTSPHLEVGVSEC